MSDSDATPRQRCSDEHRTAWILAAVERYEGPLLRYADSMLNDIDRARDVVQDTFLQLCRQPSSAARDRLAAWLFTVCRNRSIDMIRKEKRMKTLSDHQADQHPSPDDPVADADNRDDARHVLELLRNLSENQREVVRLKFEGGLTYREIAEVTSLSESNVGYLLHTALHKLREQLAK